MGKGKLFASVLGGRGVGHSAPGSSGSGMPLPLWPHALGRRSNLW